MAGTTITPTPLRALHHAHPDDLDLRALFVEAMLNRTPWMLWDVHAGTPAEGADTVEAMETLEKAIQQMDEGNLPPHAGIMHLYIHTMEMSPYPERALPAADALRGLHTRWRTSAPYAIPYRRIVRTLPRRRGG